MTPRRAQAERSDRRRDPAERRDPAALVAYLDAAADRPFAWGRRGNDCVSFAARAVKAQTGQTIASMVGDLRWAGARGAVRALAKAGSLETVLDRRFARIPPALAARGDIGAVPDERFGLRLMIVEGATLAGPGDRGIRREPRAALVAAWSITEPPDV